MNNQTLPSFDNPPLTEVVLSVQFSPIQEFDIPQMGQCWNHFKSKFPIIERHQPLNRRIERTGIKRALFQLPQFSLEQTSTPPLPRLWFISKNGNELLQLQQDRFIRNWRKIGDNDQYPRYEESIRPEFMTDFKNFNDFLSSNNLASLTIDQCEVTYINHISTNDVWQNHSDISKIFDIFTETFDNRMPLSLEDTAFKSRFTILNDNKEFIGRLHLDISSGFKNTEKQEPIFIVNLTARGQPLGEGIDGVIDFMNIARSSIVKTFDAVTTPEMHKSWGKN